MADRDQLAKESSNRVELTGLPNFTTQLLQATSVEEALDVVAGFGRPVVGAELVSIVLREPDGRIMRTVTSRELPMPIRQELARFSIDYPLPSRDALRTGKPVLLETRDQLWERYPELKRLQLDVGSLAVLPIVNSGNPLGALVLGWSKAHHFPASEVELITTVAQCCSAVVIRAEKHRQLANDRDAAQGAAARLSELQHLSVELARATQVAEVADVIVSTAAKSLGATAASLAGYDHNTDLFTLLASSGLPPEGAVRWSSFPRSASPLAADQVRTLKPVLITSYADRIARYPDMANNQVPQEAWANIPLILDGRVIGLASFGWDNPRDFTTTDVEHLTALASHATVALDRAHLIATTRSAAETLQNALLPGAMPVSGWQTATVYLPAVRGTHVGGDWYDVFELPDGAVGLVIGDVAGKGIEAAATMGSVRSALRAFATSNPDPASVLSALDTFVDRFFEDMMVTCCYAALDPHTGALQYSRAGHPPALLVDQDGSHWLDAAAGLPLGVGNGHPRIVAREQLDAETNPVVVFYSDGLVERRTASIIAGMADLAHAGRSLVGAEQLGPSLHDLIKTLHHPDSLEDDLAVLALRPKRTSGVTATENAHLPLLPSEFKGETDPLAQRSRRLNV
ncbi:MAG: GAF domain-containing SpoIIE family protein phosphatase [Actinomycetota bacterium]